MKRAWFVTAVVCGVVMGSAGVGASAQWMVPAGAHAAGSEGTNWRTDLRLVNPSDTAVAVTVYLLKANVDNSGLEDSIQVTVGPGGQNIVQDVFFSSFGFEGTGALLVECGAADLVVTTRTYNQVPGGTYGQFIPAVPVQDALQPGDEGHILYLAKSDGFRTNLGFAATTPQGGMVTVSLFLSNGGHGGQNSFTFSPYGQRQVNDIFAAIGAGADTGARIVVTTNAPVIVYASVVDENTGDPVAVMAVRESQAAREQVVSAAARAGGAEGSVWRTDLRIFNPASETALVEFTYHKKGRTGAGQAEATISVGGGNFDTYDDAMMSIFGLSSANGAIRVVSSHPVLIFTRTFNQGVLGTYGQAIPGEPLDGALLLGQMRVFTGLSNDGFRSNAGFVNVSNDDAQVDISVWDASGVSRGNLSVDLGPNEMNQVDDILGQAGVGPGFTGSASVVSDGAVVPFVSVIDNASNDPVYEAGAHRSGAFGAGGGGGGGGGGGAGDCVSLEFPEPGTEATWRFHTEEQGEIFEFESTSVFHSATSTASHVSSVQEMMVAGFTSRTETDTHSFYRILDNPQGHLELERTETHVETTIAEITTEEDTTVTLNPPEYQGPATRVCDGETWTSPSVTSTTVSSSFGTTTEQTESWEGVIESIDDVKTVEAGTFTCIVRKTTETSGDSIGWSAFSWTDRATGVMVKMELYDTTMTLKGSSELIDLN